MRRLHHAVQVNFRSSTSLPFASHWGKIWAVSSHLLRWPFQPALILLDTTWAPNRYLVTFSAVLLHDFLSYPTSFRERALLCFSSGLRTGETLVPCECLVTRQSTQNMKQFRNESGHFILKHVIVLHLDIFSSFYVYMACVCMHVCMCVHMCVRGWESSLIASKP